jgi:hypothetical protein
LQAAHKLRPQLRRIGRQTRGRQAQRITQQLEDAIPLGVLEIDEKRMDVGRPQLGIEPSRIEQQRSQGGLPPGATHMVGKRPPYIWVGEREWITPPVEQPLVNHRRIGEPFG